MYILINLAISSGFGFIDWANLEFPGKMLIDYVRVYQPKGQINIGCDPEDFPTQATSTATLRPTQTPTSPSGAAPQRRADTNRTGPETASTRTDARIQPPSIPVPTQPQPQP
ncbi:hypothetical protein L1887_57374 [Cichorium endivia]|nr:hypothetical protein L1887_57374 [Cichorium endivia]